MLLDLIILENHWGFVLLNDLFAFPSRPYDLELNLFFGEMGRMGCVHDYSAISLYVLNFMSNWMIFVHFLDA